MRYLDLFMYFVSVYNTLMKVFFISSTAYIIFLMRFKKPYCDVSTFQGTGISCWILLFADLCVTRPMMPWEMTFPT